MITVIPEDLTTLTVRMLDALRASVGREKLAIRVTAYAERPHRRNFVKSVLAELRPYNVAIDRINAEQARREEAAFQVRQEKRARRITVAV